MDLNKFQNTLSARPELSGRQQYPVQDWDPPFCGDIDICIDLNGTWTYQQSPITRRALVQLFSALLKKENEDYFIVSPVEKVRIQVVDVPFIICEASNKDDVLHVTTQTGDKFTVSSAHEVVLRSLPTTLQSPDAVKVPYVRVRDELWARVDKTVYYQWVEQAELKKTSSSITSLELKSGDYSFSVGGYSSDSI